VIVGDTVHLALRNLRQAKLRTGLTTMGVAIGIASLAGMVSLGVGLQEQLVGRFMNSGLFDVITVLPDNLAFSRTLVGRGGRAGRGATVTRETPAGPAGRAAGLPDAQPDNAKPLDDAALDTIRAMADVKDVSPMIVVPIQIAYGATSEFTSARGVPMTSGTDNAFKTPKYGAFFSNETDHAVLLNLATAQRLTTGDPKDLIGKDLTISYATSTGGAGGGMFGMPMPMQVQQVQAAYRIVGIMERDPAAIGVGSVQISNVMLPLAQAKDIDAHAVAGMQQLLRPASGAKTKTYASVTVRVTRAAATKDVEEKIKALGFTAFSISDALDQAKRAFVLLDIMLSLIGSIALAVSSLGIVNTMVMSILERTREIGIMKAIGGSDADVRKIFLVEASAIGLLGGVSGVILGWVVGRIINFGANWYIESQGGTTGNLFSLPIWLISGAIAFSWLVSLAAGVYPATRAARLDPIQALRHD
jgi:putative ABC transport system permease protein